MPKRSKSKSPPSLKNSKKTKQFKSYVVSSSSSQSSSSSTQLNTSSPITLSSSFLSTTTTPQRNKAFTQQGRMNQSVSSSSSSDSDLVFIEPCDRIYPLNQPSDSIIVDNQVLELYRPDDYLKTPPRSCDEKIQNEIIRAYIPYMRQLYNVFPNKFTQAMVKKLKKYERVIKENLSFNYNVFRNYIKNASGYITKTAEQRLNDNENHAFRNKLKREMGFCTCNQPLSMHNKARCDDCSAKEATRLRKVYLAMKGNGYCGVCHLERNLDGTCKGCANIYMRHRMKSLNLFQTKIKGLPENHPITCNRCAIQLEHVAECVCFTLHHARYQDEKRPQKRCRNLL